MSTFTDVEFDALIATLGWEALLRRVDPDLQACIHSGQSVPSPDEEPTQQQDDIDLFD